MGGVSIGPAHRRAASRCGHSCSASTCLSVSIQWRNAVTFPSAPKVKRWISSSWKRVPVALEVTSKRQRVITWSPASNMATGSKEWNSSVDPTVSKKPATWPCPRRGAR